MLIELVIGSNTVPSKVIDVNDIAKKIEARFFGAVVCVELGESEECSAFGFDNDEEVVAEVLRICRRETLTKMTKFVIVLKRAIPVSDYSVDTVTGIFDGDSNLDDVQSWIDATCGGSCSLVSAEITVPAKIPAN